MATANSNYINPELKEIVGDALLPVISLLKGNGFISEIELAKKASMDINEVRTILYHLQELNLVDFRREREKKTGWYIYYWALEPRGIRPLVSNLRKQKLLKMREELKRENGGSFFSCLHLCVRLDFEAATNFNYRCPECGGTVQLEDNIQRIKKLKEGIIKLEKAIEAV